VSGAMRQTSVLKLSGSGVVVNRQQLTGFGLDRLDSACAAGTIPRKMKLNSRNRGLFVLVIALSLIIGTFAWAILERILDMVGLPIHLEVGPVGFDVGVMAASVHVNPGTLLGIIPGLFIFKNL